MLTTPLALCIKCRTNLRAGTGQRWCRACKTERQREGRRQARLPPPSSASSELNNAAPALPVCASTLKNGPVLGVGADSSAPSVEMNPGAAAGVRDQAVERSASCETIIPATVMKNAAPGCDSALKNGPKLPATPVKNAPEHLYDLVIRQWASKRGLKIKIV